MMQTAQQMTCLSETPEFKEFQKHVAQSAQELENYRKAKGEDLIYQNKRARIMVFIDLEIAVENRTKKIQEWQDAGGYSGTGKSLEQWIK